MRNENLKRKIINAIYELSEDEFENFNDFKMLYDENIEELTDRLIHIAKWYQMEYNNFNEFENS